MNCISDWLHNAILWDTVTMTFFTFKQILCTLYTPILFVSFHLSDFICNIELTILHCYVHLCKFEIPTLPCPFERNRGSHLYLGTFPHFAMSFSRPDSFSICAGRVDRFNAALNKPTAVNVIGKDFLLSIIPRCSQRVVPKRVRVSWNGPRNFLFIAGNSADVCSALHVVISDFITAGRVRHERTVTLMVRWWQTWKTWFC